MENKLEVELKAFQEEKKIFQETIQKSRFENVKLLEESTQKCLLLEDRLKSAQNELQRSEELIRTLSQWIASLAHPSPLRESGNHSPDSTSESSPPSPPSIVSSCPVLKFSLESSKKKKKGKEGRSRPCLLNLFSDGSLTWHLEPGLHRHMNLRQHLFRLHRLTSEPPAASFLAAAPHQLEIQSESDTHLFLFSDPSLRNDWYVQIKEICSGLIAPASDTSDIFLTYAPRTTGERSQALSLMPESLVAASHEGLGESRPGLSGSGPAGEAELPMVRPKQEYTALSAHAVAFQGVEFRIHELDPFKIYPPDAPIDRTYDSNHALWFSHLAHLAYGNRETIQSIVQHVFKWPEPLCFDDAATDSHAYALANDHFAVVAFRGTASSTNWSTNLDSGREPLFDAHGSYPPHWQQWRRKVLVHSGFKQACLTLWPRIEAHLLDLRAQRGPHFPVYITGHSLGGALATVCFLLTLLRSEPIPIQGVTTFGQPRVGNSWMGKFISQHSPVIIQRIQNSSDVVPNVPTSSAGYRHCGLHILILNDGKILRNPPISQQRQENASQFASGIANHSMVNYIKMIRLNEQRFHVASAAPGRSGKSYRVFIDLECATGLFAADLTGTSDPYVRVTWGRGESVRSATKLATLNPQWNEILEIPRLSASTPEVIVQLYDYDKWSRDDFLGQVVFDFSSFQDLPVASFPLQPRPGKKSDHYVQGSVTLGFRFFKEKPMLVNLGKTKAPLFGSSLQRLMKEQQLQREFAHLHIPWFATQAVAFLFQHALAAPFSPPDLEQTQRVGVLRQAFLSGELDAFDDSHHPLDALLLFATWLHELPEPLLTFDLYEPFLLAVSSPPLYSDLRPPKLDDLHRLCLLLPLPNRTLVALLLSFLEQRMYNRKFNLGDVDSILVLFSSVFMAQRNLATSKKLPISCHSRAITFLLHQMIAHHRFLFLGLIDEIPPSCRMIHVNPSVALNRLLHFKFQTRLSISSSVDRHQHSISSLHPLVTRASDPRATFLIFATSLGGRFGLFHSHQLTPSRGGCHFSATTQGKQVELMKDRRLSLIYDARERRGITSSLVISREDLPSSPIPGILGSLFHATGCHFIAILFHGQGPPSMLPIFAHDSTSCHCGEMVPLPLMDSPHAWRCGVALPSADEKIWVLAHERGPQFLLTQNATSLQLNHPSEQPVVDDQKHAIALPKQWSSCLLLHIAKLSEIWVFNGHDQTCYIFDAHQGHVKDSFLLGSSFEMIRTLSLTPVRAFALFPDQSILFTAGSEICSWLTAPRTLIHSASSSVSAIRSLNLVSHDSQTLLLSGHEDSTVGMWCSIALVLLATIQLGGGQIVQLLPMWIPYPNEVTHSIQHDSQSEESSDKASDRVYVVQSARKAADGYFALWIADSLGYLNVWTSISTVIYEPDTLVSLPSPTYPSKSPSDQPKWVDVRRRDRRHPFLSTRSRNQS